MEAESTDATVNDILQLISDAESIIDETEASLASNDGVSAAFGVEKFHEVRHLIAACKSVVDAADKLILPARRATALQAALAATVQALTRSTAVKDGGHLQPQIADLREELWQWQGAFAKVLIQEELSQFRIYLSDRVDEEISGRRRLLEDYRQHLDLIRAEAASLSAKLRDYEALQEQISSAVRSAEVQFADERRKRSSEFSAELEEQEERLERTVTNWGSELERRIRTVEEESERTINGLQAEFDRRIRLAETEYSTQSQRFERLSNGALASAGAVRDRANQADEGLRQTEERINKLHREAQESSAARGRDALTKEFRDEADSQKRKADLWRNLALGIAAATIVIGILLLVLTLNDGPTSVGEVVGKALLVSAAGGIASYCASQSTGHRRREVVAKWVQLQMESIDSSIQPLDEAKKAEARMLLIKTVYGSAAKGDDDSGAWGDTRTLAQFAAYLRQDKK